MAVDIRREGRTITVHFSVRSDDLSSCFEQELRLNHQGKLKAVTTVSHGEELLIQATIRSRPAVKTSLVKIKVGSRFGGPDRASMVVESTVRGRAAVVSGTIADRPFLPFATFEWPFGLAQTPFTDLRYVDTYQSVDWPPDDFGDYAALRPPVPYALDDLWARAALKLFREDASKGGRIYPVVSCLADSVYYHFESVNNVPTFCAWAARLGLALNHCRH